MVCCIRKRLPKRTFSMAMYFWSKSNSSEKRTEAFSPKPSVNRKKSPSKTHISRARDGSMLVKALMELRLLNKK